MHRFNTTFDVQVVTEQMFSLFFSLKDLAFKMELTSKTWKGERTCNMGQSLSSPLPKETFELKSAFYLYFHFPSLWATASTNAYRFPEKDLLTRIKIW